MNPPDFLYRLKQHRGGMVYDGGTRWVGPGPGHNPRDRSLSVWVTESGSILVHSFSGDPFDACVSYLGLGYRAVRVDQETYQRLRRERLAETHRQRKIRLAFCHRMLEGAVALEGSPGAIYFAERGIGWFPQDVVFHPNAPKDYEETRFGPAILAVARVGTPIYGLQATYLRRNLKEKTGRASFGDIMGSAVRLLPGAPAMAVAEGLETAASYAELEGVPTWATLGTANLKMFEPPAYVRHLTIAADGDVPGLEAAHTLAARCRCDVTIASAPAGSDWNDVATGKVSI